jgi:hypothetical protein
MSLTWRWRRIHAAARESISPPSLDAESLMRELSPRWYAGHSHLASGGSLAGVCATQRMAVAYARTFLGAC